MHKRGPAATAAGATIVDVLLAGAQQRGDAPLYAFFEEDQLDATELSFREVDRRARAVGSLLQEAGAAGERVVLLYAPGAAYVSGFLGCLYAGAIAVPAFPPDPSRIERTLPRLQAIIRDAGARFALTTAATAALFKEMAPELTEGRALEWIAADAIDPGAEGGWRHPRAEARDLAFLQYTSGSTSSPRGVMVSHGSLMQNEAAIARAFQVGSETVGVSWLPPYHDMGLIGDLLQPIYSGCRQIIISPLSFLKRPLGWLELISRFRGTVSGGPNFAYDLCARRATPDAVAKLDLRSWKVAYCGAEPVRAATLARFAATFAPAGFDPRVFVPCYGLAEATLLVTGNARPRGATVRRVRKSGIAAGRLIDAPDGDTEAVDVVGCGATQPGHEILIVDAGRRAERMPNEVGEIWISGPSVCPGYYGRPEESESTFGARLSDGRGPFLVSGDLGCVADGELYVLGRQKDLILIDGTNHYPQDIELTVELAHPALRHGCGAAFSIDDGSAERIVLAQEVDPDRCSDPQAVIEAIRAAVALRHQLPLHEVVLVAPRTVPKTSSGKIQRHAARAAFLEGTLQVVGRSRQDGAPPGAPGGEEGAPSDALEAQIAAAWAEVLGRDRIGAHEDFFASGGNSLLAMQLVSKLSGGPGLPISLEQLFTHPTISRLAAAARDSAVADPPIERAPAREHYAVSNAQKRIWLFERLYGQGSTAYVICYPIELQGELDAAAFAWAVERVIERHEALRTTFVEIDGAPRQKVHAKLPSPFDVVDLRGAADPWTEVRAAIERESALPFDMERGPLVRGRLLRVEDARHALVLSIHHIITDETSMNILFDDLLTVYHARIAGEEPRLPELRVQYRDYAEWESRLLASDAVSPHRAYWLERLAPPLARLELPTDKARPSRMLYHGARATYVIDGERRAALLALCREERATWFMLLVTLVKILLHKHTRQEDILVGAPVSSRDRPELERQIGFYVNTVVLRDRITAADSIAAVLRQVKETVTGALAHQRYPYDDLLDDLGIRREINRNPLFDVWVFVNRSGFGEETHNARRAREPPSRRLRVRAIETEHAALKFDLMFKFLDTPRDTGVLLEYSTELFRRETAERMLRHFADLVSIAIADPRAPLHEVSLGDDGRAPETVEHLAEEW